MKKGNLWKRGLFTTGLGLSIFLSSFGNVTGARAAELPGENNALEIQNQSETEASDEEKVTDESTEEVTEKVTEKVTGEVTEDASEDAVEETEGEETTTSEEDSTGDAVQEADGEFLSTAESCEGEYTVSLAEAATVKRRAPRDRKASDNAEVNKENVHDGAILQAFCWSFNTIADNMAAIADAGYTAVQTSPINECLDTNPGKNLHGPDGMWYYHYQPTDWVIGNYQLGSRDEFKHMCDVADEYGIAVIVDILPNHTTTSLNNVSDKLYEAAGGKDSLYHTTGMTAGGYSDRLELTYYQMGGLPDVDTENISFQEYFFEFLKDCVYLGADGFRIDTAKHIALPDDPVPASYEDTDRNTFYPNMREALNEYAGEVGTKSYDELFVYGEVLQGGGDRLAAYQEYIGGTTASGYGANLRSSCRRKPFCE